MWGNHLRARVDHETRPEEGGGKYLRVRRTALFIEESLYRGTQWVVFEPNDEPLWAQIRLNIGAFMNELFRRGVFQGLTPTEAYFVKCDKETTTQTHINSGIVNIGSPCPRRPRRSLRRFRTRSRASRRPDRTAALSASLAAGIDESNPTARTGADR